MELKCIKTLSVGGRTAYYKGETYEAVELEDGTLEVRSDSGVGIWDMDERKFKEHFQVVTNDQPATQEIKDFNSKRTTSGRLELQPTKKENKVVSLFKRLF